MDRQSEWIILRRVCAFLRSRNLKATAQTLEQEAAIKFDYPHVRGLLRRGRWRSADKYVSAFLGDDIRTPAASAALCSIRFERFVRALKRGSRDWALRYFDRSIEPLRANHPRMDLIDASRARVLSCRPGSLRRTCPDDAQHRERCVARFSGLIRLQSNERQLHRCRRAFVHDKFMCSRIAGTLALRNPFIPMKRKPKA